MDEQQKRLAEELLFGTVKKPGFAKLLYFGIFDGDKVFPFPRLNPAEEERNLQLLEQLQAFADKEIDPDWIDRNSAIPDAVIEGLGKMGILGMTIPAEYGGLGVSQCAYCKAVELLSSHCASTALFVNAHQSVGLKALLLFGTEEQKKRWLPPLAKGELLAAFSLTEPNAGSDASAVETKAIYDAEKNVYRLTGQKQWTTNGSIAHILTVMAQTEIDTPQGKQNKITAFLVTPDMPGFKVTAASLEKVGMRGSKTANLEFQNMEVPAANILGPMGGGLKVALTVLDYGRTTFGATCTGAAKFLVNRAIQHARTRYQFKRPLGSFALVKQKIAMMSALTYAMDASTYLTAGLIDAQVEDIMLESAILKVFASDSLWSILYDTMQIYGGRSFFTDQPFERMMRDARLNMIGEGANEVMRAFIGVVGMRDVGMQLKAVSAALSSPLDSYELLWKFSKQSFDRILTPKVPVKSPLLQKEATHLGERVRSFGFNVARALARYREQILEKQLVLDRFATAAIALYTTTAVLSKLDADLARVQGNAEALGNDVSIAKFYCQYAMDRVDCVLNSLQDNYDDSIESLSDQITGIKFP